jgi:hypothetical protein
MYVQQKQSVADGSFMKMIALITLLYLPITFVSVRIPDLDLLLWLSMPVSYSSTNRGKLQSLFSTNLIDLGGSTSSNNSDNSTSSSLPAIHRFFEIALPLTLVTFGIMVSLYLYESRRFKRIDRSLSLNDSKV